MGGSETFIPKTIQCKQHGCVIPGANHPVISFMDDFTAHYITSPTIVEMVTASFKSHAEVWKEDVYKKMALNILTSMGTNMSLREQNSSVQAPNHEGASCLAKFIVILEHYDGTGDSDNAAYVQCKIRDLNSGVSSCLRDTVKFYSKRLSCSCLKNMHSFARKNLPKKGFCWHCDKEKSRALLHVCSKCMITQYCSRECQVADAYMHIHAVSSRDTQMWDQHSNEINTFMYKTTAMR